MPKYLRVPKDADREGVQIGWTPFSGYLEISGWYDSIVGIESRHLTLKEFFQELGITEKDCKKAFKEESNDATKRANKRSAKHGKGGTSPDSVLSKKIRDSAKCDDSNRTD